jgi:hypothetical protein
MKPSFDCESLLAEGKALAGQENPRVTLRACWLVATNTLQVSFHPNLRVLVCLVPSVCCGRHVPARPGSWAAGSRAPAANQSGALVVPFASNGQQLSRRIATLCNGTSESARG